MVVGIAENLLESRVRTVLDVGCGEGSWLAPLRRLRPAIDYTGLDGSDYVAKRFGRSRNISRASFGETGEAIGNRTFDLVVSSDVLHYIDEEELEDGLPAIAAATKGIAFLDLLTVEDEPTGDLRAFRMRAAGWYSEKFAAAGLVGCGMQCYVGPRSVVRPSALDLAGELKIEN